MSQKSEDPPKREETHSQEQPQSVDDGASPPPPMPEDETEETLEQIIADLIASKDPDEEELERVIADLIERRYAAAEGSPEYRFVIRQLRGLWFTRELAGPIIEELDPFGWGAIAAPLPSTGNPEGRLIQPFRKVESDPERDPS